MKAYGGVEHSMLTQELHGEWSASRLGRFIYKESNLVSIQYEAEWDQEPIWTLYKKIYISHHSKIYIVCYPDNVVK
jgi:hypothetical protein